MEGAQRCVGEYLEGQERGPGFGNARLAPNLFEQAIAQQAQRLVRRRTHTDIDRVTITAPGLPAADVPETDG